MINFKIIKFKMSKLTCVTQININTLASQIDALSDDVKLYMMF